VGGFVWDDHELITWIAVILVAGGSTEKYLCVFGGLNGRGMWRKSMPAVRRW